MKSVSQHLLNGSVYPDFTQIPSPKEPRIRLIPLEPDKEREVLRTPGYSCAGSPYRRLGWLLPQISGREEFFYSGDTTGEGLAGIWLKMRPDLVVVEVTYPNSKEHLAHLTSHLTPRRLGKEITGLKQSGGNIPKFLVTHLNTKLEEEIKEEVRLLAASIEVPITPAHEELVVVI